MAEDDCPGVMAYGICIPQRSCEFFMRIPRIYQCQFVKQTPDCNDDTAYLNYMEIFACHYNNYDGQIYISILIILTELCLLFLFLSCTADHFFAPSLCAISNMLGLSEQLAGVTLLAFGNSSPDIVTSMIGASFLGPELVVCQLLGGGIFVTSVVAASILLTRQFHADKWSFMRDTIFYMLAIGWLFLATDDNVIQLYETLTLVILYVCYVVFVILDAVRKKREGERHAAQIQVAIDNQKNSEIKTTKASLKGGIEDEERVSSLDELQYKHLFEDNRRDMDTINKFHILARTPTVVENKFHIPPPLIPRRRASSTSVNLAHLSLEAERIHFKQIAGMKEEVREDRMGHHDSIIVKKGDETLYGKKRTLIEDLINNLNPVDEEDWFTSSFPGKLFILLQAPVVYLFKLVIPVIDQGALNNGWCKLLNTMLCITSPLFSAYAFSITSFSPLIYVPIFSVVSILGAVAAYFVFTRSRIDKAPKFHPVFAVFGFIISMQMIYTVAHELVYVIDIAGNILSINIPTLAMTVLAWGNSIGDLVANTSLARAGYPRMAWAGCFGSPLMSGLLGAGSSLTYLIETKGHNHSLEFRPRYKGLIANCFFFLFLSLASSLVIMPSLNYQCRRSYGLYLLIVYFMFLLFISLCESELIHPLRPEVPYVQKGASYH